MSYKYLVTLKPMGEFFFGSEQSFSKNDMRNKVSFFAKSFMFMQQNSILGMLRKEILRRGHLKIHINGEWPDLPKNRNGDSKEWLEIKNLVGFEPFDFKKEIDTGIIEDISEVFLKRDNQVFYQMPFDEDLNSKKTDKKVSFNGKIRDFIDFGIDSKTYENDYLISKNEKLSYSEVFIESESVGIKKNSDKEGFFQKTAYKLKDNFEFAFILTLKQEIDLNGVVSIGGDGSNFVLKMEKFEDNLEYPEFSKKEGFDRIVLLSEAYVDEKIEDLCDYIFAEHLIFRGVKSGNNKTKRVRILKRGSVFYTKNIKEVEKLLKNHLYKFGFNRFKRR